MKIFEWRFLPIALFVILIITYVLSNQYFINCNGRLTVCDKIESENISEVPADKVFKLASVGKVLNEDKKTELKKKEELVKNQQEAIGLIKDKINEVNKKIIAEKSKTETKPENTPASPTPTPTATPTPNPAPTPKTLAQTKTELEAELKTQTELLTTLEADREKSVSAILGIRQQVSERYSKRLVFMFLTSAFVLLCLAAIGFSISAIKESLESMDDASKNISIRGKNVPIMKYWQWIALVGAVGFGGFVYFGLEDEAYFMVEPLFSQSIWSNGDISKGLVHFVNCLGFTATVWLVFAGNAILYAVITKRDAVQVYEDQNLTDEKLLERLEAQEQSASRAKSAFEALPETDPHKTAQIERLDGEIKIFKEKIIALTIALKDKFAPYQKSITAILYIGALMLFVGMLRVQLASDWHLIFVSTDTTNKFYLLLASFFKSSIGVQAIYYSVLLLVIYLPVVYAIPGGEESETAPEKNMLQQIGLPFSSEYLTKLLAVFSPVLAGPIAELFNYLVGKTG